jgi:integrase
MVKRVLNDRIIKALKPAAAGKRNEVWDALVPDLGVRVTETGAKSFVLATRYPGAKNPTRRALGSYGALMLEQARGKAREWLRLIEKGIDPVVEIERQRLTEARKAATTFGAVADDFINEKASRERRGNEAARIIRRELLPKWGDRPVADITPLDVVLLLKPIKARGEYMAHATLSVVKRLFGWAVDSHVYGLVVSPADRLRPKSIIGEKHARSRILADDEVRAFWRACIRMGYPHGDLGRLLVLSGTRHREAAAAPWSEFDLAKKTWTIDQARFKSAVEHIVPLTADMLALLNGLPRFRAGSFLFSTCAGRVPTDITEKVKSKIDARMLRTLKAMARIRGDDPSTVTLRPWVVHDLRRVVRSHLAALRIPDHVAEMVLGHGKRGLQRVYDQHRYEDELREALERWAARLRSIIKPAAANVVAIERARVSL